jgi:CRISPR-associated endonuclease/helicase Cas3
MRKDAAYLQFWGKAGGARQGEPAWHPAAYHNLDVAAVADVLLQSNPRKLAQMALLLSTSPDSARRTLVALIALHDIGKFADAFQRKVPEAWPTAVLGEIKPIRGPRHDQTSFDLREKLNFFTLFGPVFDVGWRPSHVAMLWGAIAGHHGKPVDINGSTEVPDGMRRAGIDAAIAYANDVALVLGPFDKLPKPTQSDLAALSWSVAGLAVVADWIGSNREFFAYRYPELTLAEYWLQTQSMARKAVEVAGIGPTPVATDVSAATLFPTIVNLSPLQTWATTVAYPPGPSLTIIEDVTGSGKTEAALLLAARMIQENRADGLFFALPTMATANAMFDRLGDSYRRIFDANAAPSLVLAHGRRTLHVGFQASILSLSSTPHSERIAETIGDQSNAVCSAWVADDRRKAFLAHVGVGTIDQAFLGTLPSKYQTLRLWGLSDRVLIVDEAHAYDAYMGRELERLLEFHAALGGSAVILSATLPAAQRAALSSAFAKGLGKAGHFDQTRAYPLVTLVSAVGTQSFPLATREDRTRRLPVRRIDSCDNAIAHVVDMAGRGAAVAWIRNSVDDAIEAVEQLRMRGLEPVLLHARFAMGDRLKIEDRVRRTLGKNGDPAERQGFVLIGTQILEQSLDYDVDAMITDLAPIDLMIQRAGRLWRHTERIGRPITTPELLVLSPDWQAVEDKNWYRQISPRAAAVYGHHGLVWRSAKTLFEAGAIETPSAVRSLIESVYGVDGLDDIPLPLLHKSQEAEGQRSAARAIAGANLLKVQDGYGGDATIWTADSITPTRLGDPVTVFRLGRVEAGVVVPWCKLEKDGDLRRTWALSEVSLSQRKAVGVPDGNETTVELVRQVKEIWPEWEREQPLLLLEQNGGIWRGDVVDRASVTQTAVYHKAIGLQIVPAA